jgi:hypothetical protein
VDKSLRISNKISFENISLSNVSLITQIDGDLNVKAAKKMLKKKDIGIFALRDGALVGYGWCKYNRSTDDYFMKGFNNKEAYLCRFYVTCSHRGEGFYGLLISYIMNYMYLMYNIVNLQLQLISGIFLPGMESKSRI